jgi:DNA polymerase-3 subunit epsilon
MDGMIKKTSQDQRLPNLPREDFDQLPDKPGVYYFDEHKSNIYGKAVKHKKRVASHLEVIKSHRKDNIFA